ncbi:MAG: hypothetical protein GTO51_05320 [Candidatus Latescibacteria bacterium]|nr:hypothetical protein [Candidatus Latescibacterota bacterium]NIO28423.1 hypothetical protein [Candidatus Latescibacterota bacterium]NIO55972.1 hypothetical protein [Candidatus Latescibacterota bacterium]NIT01936.1 hypothetical protein [Candidatus Latescibacterota bacterium]
MHGFDVNTVHVLLQTAVACSLLMSVDVEEAIFPTDPNCPEPGSEWCNSGLYLVVLPGPGAYDIGLPIDCPCLAVFPPYKYLLSFRFEAANAPVDLITDNFPSPCTSWNNWGLGWKDLVVEYGFPGNLSFYADADCCEPTIPVEGKTWGAIKQLYKQ